MKITGRNTRKYLLKSLAKCKGFCKFEVTTNAYTSHGNYYYYFISYIRAAGGLSHRDRYLSLSTAFRLFHAPTGRIFFTSNDNDK